MSNLKCTFMHMNLEKLKTYDFYVDKEVYSLGLAEVETTFRNRVRTYNI